MDFEGFWWNGRNPKFAIPLDRNEQLLLNLRESCHLWLANNQTWATITINNKTRSKRSRLKNFANSTPPTHASEFLKVYLKTQGVCKDY
jgi:hypothetical protein